MFNVLTIAREYGSGGSDIGHKAAELMGWECVDKQIIERVAAKGKVDPSWTAEGDERSSAWWERALKGFRHGSPEYCVGVVGESGVDHDALQQFTASVIQEAAKVGKCVIIGRGSQCVLQQDPHVLRVLVYAPLTEKIKRIKLRHPHEHDLQTLLHRMDSERAHYVQNYYGCDSSNRGLYHLCINSTLSIDASAKLIVQTIQSS
jgi:hypothetical protein